MPVQSTGTYYSGSTCSVLVGAVVYNAGGWEANLNIEFPDVTTGAAAGAKERVAGCYELTGNIEMPFNSQKMPPTGPRGVAQQAYLLTLYGYQGATPIVCYAFFKWRLRTKTDQAFQWTCEFVSTGTIDGI